MELLVKKAQFLTDGYSLEFDAWTLQDIYM